jgi:hypothetical protein
MLNSSCYLAAFFLDLHAHLALDRREEWKTPQAGAVPLWFARSEYRRVRSQVRLHTVRGRIVSLLVFFFMSLFPESNLPPPPM